MTNVNPNKANMISILTPWVDKPAGLFYSTITSMSISADYGSESSVTNEQRIAGVTNLTLIMSYIASCHKDGLTKPAKDIIINTQYAWGIGLLTKEQIATIADKGANMTEKQFDYYFNQIKQILG